MAGIDINRTTSGVNLPPAVSSEIWSNAQNASVVMQLARQITMPGSGVSIPTITGDAQADWVDETEEKPISRAAFGQAMITPYKLAVIEPFSNEFRRDLPALYQELARRLPNALAVKFDQTVLGTTPPGSNFDTLGGSTTQDVSTDTYNALLSVVSTVAAADGMLSGWGMAPQGEALMMGAVDGNGRPLFLTDLQRQGSVGQLLGRSVYLSKALFAAGTPNVIGLAGDFANAMYGTVEGVQVSVSDQATLNDGGTQLNLWQRNMFAIRAEIEVGFKVRDAAQFVRLTDGAAAG